MDILALGIALLALVLGALAFYRSRGQENLRATAALSEKIERLGTLAEQATVNLAAKVRERYERNMRMIGDMQSRVAALKEEAMEELREDLGSVTRKLESLAERARRELRDLKSGLDFTILELEIGVRLTLDDTKAHLKLIEAKRELILARRAALRNDLAEAKARATAALKYIDEAQSLALGQHDNLVALQRQAQAMLAILGKEANATRAAIDTLLERSNRLLDEMAESKAAARNAA
jgi:hypothetical protein